MKKRNYLKSNSFIFFRLLFAETRKCDVRIATLNNDNTLCEKNAKLVATVQQRTDAKLSV